MIGRSPDWFEVKRVIELAKKWVSVGRLNGKVGCFTWNIALGERA